jgi:hypothetical protein
MSKVQCKFREFSGTIIAIWITSASSFFLNSAVYCSPVANKDRPPAKQRGGQAPPGKSEAELTDTKVYFDA